MDPINTFTNFFKSPLFTMFIQMFFIFLLILWVALAFWAYQDSKKRGAYASLWATASLLFPIFGWLIYLIVRPAEYLDDIKERELEIKTMEANLKKAALDCPGCHKPINDDFLICPSCRKKLKNACPKCKKALDLNWEVCPYCKNAIKIGRDAS